MSDAADIDVLAAEYVLGTLDASERVQIAGRLEREPALRSAVADWEQRLQPLTQLVRPVEPPSGLLSKIEQTLALSLASSGVLAASAGSSNVVNMDLQRSLRRWRSTAIAASAMAASLAVVLGLREVARPSVDQNFVAVFQKDDASPSFVMAVDLTKRTLSVQRVAADVPAGKTYQLWIASDKLGVGPQSLGLVEGDTKDVRRAISGIDPAIVQHALFGVSLEPAGGSPTGKPTGPVFHAKLIPTSN